MMRAAIKEFVYKMDVNSLAQQPIDSNVRLNEVVKVTIRTASPLVFDTYKNIRANGSAILIDETSNSTVATVLFQ